MKNVTQRMKRLLSLIMVIAMVMTMLPTVAFAAGTPETLYLKPNSNWTQGSARFAAYFFGSGEKWVSMTDLNGDGIYEVDVPTEKKYPSVIFCRMDPSNAANNWDTKWNQTADLTVPTDGNNLYTVKNGTWDKGGGTWSVYTYVMPTYTVAGTISPAGWSPENGEKLTDEDGDGVFTYTYTNVDAGSYSFKVTNGSWDSSWPSSDYSLTVADDGSNVMITFDAVNKTVSATVEKRYNVTFNGTNVTSNGEQSVKKGETYTATLTPAEGYTLPETVTVTGGTAEYNQGTGVLKITDITGDIVITAEGVEIPTEPTYTVYFINSGKWDEVYAYAWTDGGSGLSWPGVAMTKTENTVNGFDVYTITFETEYANIIFNNNGQGSQTADLTLTVGQYYDLKSGAWYASLADVPEVDILATDAYLVGSFNGWSASANEFKLSADGATTGTVALELEANTTYEFKIIVSGAWTSCSTAITEDADDLTFTTSVADNCTLTTKAAGTYVFTWDTTANALSVEYPQAEPTPEPTTYSVTFQGTNVTSNGAEIATEGETYIATLTAAEGYTLPETVAITMGGSEVADAYGSETGEITIDNVTGDIVITAEGVEIPTEPETITVYFRNDWLWPEVYVHYWNDSQGTTWPGEVMTFAETTDAGDVYTAEIPAWATSLLFSGIENEKTGEEYRQQTPDITSFADGDAFYIHWDGANAVSKFDYTPAGEDSGEEEEPGENATYTAIFHFANTIGWSPVNLYTWIGSGTTTNGTWPGTAMTRQDENGYYTMTVSWEATSNKGLNYIFNNGSSQTKDLTLAAGLFDSETNTAEIWIELDPTSADSEGKLTFKTISSNGPLDGVLLAVSPRIDGTSVTFEYVGDDATTSVEVRGTVPDASWDAGIAMTKNEKGLWTVTVENLIPGIYEYKFVIDEDTWKADPANGKTNSEGNSVFTILDPTAEDTNDVKIHVFYSRADGIYTQENADGEATGTWNAYAWGNSIPGTRCDFAPDIFDVNGDGDITQMVTTILVDGRKTSYVALKTRMSTEAKDWLREESEVRVNLDNIVSGNIFVYVVSDGQNGQEGKLTYSVVTGADIVTANKVTGVSYDYEKDTVIVTMLEALDDSTELTVVDTRDDTQTNQVKDITVSVNTYTLKLSEIPALGELGNYKVMFDGYPYDISVDAVYASDRFAREYTYTGNDLGATWSAGSTTFRVWAPTASDVSVNLYVSGTKNTDDLIQSVPMTADVNGTWVATVEGDLNGKYYTYSVTINGENIEAVDPYARTAGVNGDRGMVIDLDSTDPDGWADDKNPNPVTTQTDAVIYELHVRDFSIDDSSGMTNKGKYLAFTEEGTTIPGTEISTGIDYLDALGITHLHLLPVYDYGSVEETTSNTFNWGYDPKNYNVPEGSYSTNPYDGAVRVKEFKQMVKSLHDHDISVVMDVVYNHVYNADTFCFNNIVPGYFSRPNSNTSGCGNDTASEREMVRKYIVESVLYWHQEYHIDGFRFDLVGLLDVDTINQIVTEVHAYCPDVIFYGEGWDMDGTNKEPGTEMAKQGNASKTPGFGYFSDSIRNGIGGSNGSSTGFASGAGNGGSMASEWLANPWWSSNPQQVIQYASCHDNYTLIDKLVLSTKASGLNDNIIKMNNLAAAFYMTAQGVPFIHAGEEFLREKLEENGDRCENSYNASDFVNHIEWSNLEKDNYAANVEYYKGLIAFRAANPALRYATSGEVSTNVQTLTAEANLLVFRVDANGTADTTDEDILVIFNANSSEKTVTLPEGEWTIYINGKNAGTTSLGTATGSVNVAGISAMVLTTPDEGKDAAGPSAKKTIYFTNNMGWTNVYAYAWTGETYHLGAWPGAEMAYVETNGYGQKIYSVTLPASETGIEGLIFHNNSGTQTVNIKPGVDGIGYYCTDPDAEGKYAVGTYTYRAPNLGDAEDYYLVGYINSTDYTGADYKFDEDGTVTTTFASDSYVYVVNGDNSETYMTDGYQGAVTSATLKDINKHSLTTDKWDKLLIPGGAEVTITMVKNDDNTITLSYALNQSGFEDKSGVQNGVTLHCWNWSFDAIADNMATIAEMGYTAIQTSPIQPLKEATSDKAVGTNWWVYYQPVDFVITTAEGNALGNKDDFKKMCDEAEKYGIQVIVDVVANHLGNMTGHDLAEAIPEYLRKDEYWHDITTDITDWNNRYDMTQHCMSGLPDLNTANDDIQGYVLAFLKECVDAGADGFRFDAAKSIETPDDDDSFASDFWPTVINGIRDYSEKDLYIYGEILDNPQIAISAYTQYMSVTDNSWGNALRGNVVSGTATLTEGYHKAADASNLVIWAESHDTYATDDQSQSSAGVSEANINKTWALVAARADAMGLYLARPESNEQLLGVASATGWDNPEVKAVNEFHNAFVGESEALGNSDGISYVVRGTTGIVLVNVSGNTANVEISVPMADGTYTDQISGNTFTVSNGKLTGTIGNSGIAVVRDRIKLSTSNMTLGNSLAINFWVYKNQLRDGVEYTAKLTRTYADGTSETKDVPMTQWVDYGTYYQVVYAEFAAKEMTDTISIEILMPDGTSASNVFTDSIQEYAMFMLDYGTDAVEDAELRTALVDMLNYGAAAQNAFGYKTDDLANADLTDAQKALATQSIDPQDQWNGTGNAYGSNLELVDNITLRLWFKNVTEGMYAKIEFTNHYNEVITTTVTFDEFMLHHAKDKIYSVPVDELVIADGSTVVTCTLYNADGSVAGTITESIESYIAYMMAQGTKDYALFEATMKFAASAYNLFH